MVAFSRNGQLEKAPKFNALVLRMNTPEAMLSITKESLTPQAGTMARWALYQNKH